MNDTDRTEIVRRLKSIQGHVGGVVRMTEDDAYCIDLIQQISAVQSALDRVTALILDNHMHTCLTEAVRGDDADERERVLGEIVDVFTAGARTRRRA